MPIHAGVGIGIQGDAPFSGDVSGVTMRNNYFHDTEIGIELRGTLTSTITDNIVVDNFIWGIASRQSLGVFPRKWVRFPNAGRLSPTIVTCRWLRSEQPRRSTGVIKPPAILSEHRAPYVGN